MGRFVKGHYDYPNEVIVEDTTGLRDRPPELEEERLRVEAEEESLGAGSEVLQDEVAGKEPQSAEKGQLKTTADIKSALDSFFDE